MYGLEPRGIAIALYLSLIHIYKCIRDRPYKDANEALNADRDAFRAVIEGAENIEAETLEAEREALKSCLLYTSRCV